ncbi:hypothetical protein FOPG_18533 [Fusarium oxysporum f. sp. conglutinans race 2 54008]|uniref:Uncharacterized protein n=1 Tax=Fusarium oxysporum f. sp. conglutinans race 2 54008 TaxID=1089457 RepID=X0GPJ5_FUSOX|nr:hypothetical protein FOPG_18533 [Fusarium oxysporum f. sp. conglutinans race 2 54008]
MLIIGGSYSNTSECDVPSVQGTHNMNLGKQNRGNDIWAEYQPELTTYIVPTDILTAVVDYNSGGATKTAPASGFDTPDVAVLMKRTAQSWTRTATRRTDSTTTAPPLRHTQAQNPRLRAPGP